MSEPIDAGDIEIKIARAEEHLTDLNRRVGQWLNEYVAGIVHEHDRETGWHEIRGKHVPETPREWGAILGDVGYNLRAALEYMVELLLIANGSTPKRSNQFPIISDIRHAHLIAVHLDGVHDAAIDVIKSVQPYARRNGTNRDVLEVIGDLANVDKHHRLHGTLIAAEAPRATWFKTTFLQSGTVTTLRMTLDISQPISDANLMAFQFIPPDAEVKVEMNDAEPIRLGVLFRNGETFPLGLVPYLISETRSILGKLKPWMTPTP